MNRRIALSLLAGAGLRQGVAHPADPQAGSDRIHIACSLSLVGDVNQNDARAAIRAWAVEIGKLGNLGVSPGFSALVPVEQLIDMVRRGAVDGFAATVPEYLKLAQYVDPSCLLVDDIYIPDGEQYLILTHQDSSLRTVADLKDRELLIFSNPSTCLAASWLDMLLDGISGCAPEKFFRQVSAVSKLSRAVLPVYFRKGDSCLVTRRGFGTMAEMNPDLAQKLRVLATSPKVVPICMAFHKDCPRGRRGKFITAVTELPKAPGGKEILALFQSHGTSLTDSSILRGSEEIVRGAARARSRGGRPAC